MPRSQEDIKKFYVSLIHSRERKSSEDVVFLHTGDTLWMSLLSNPTNAILFYSD